MFHKYAYEAFTDELLKLAGLTTEEAKEFKKALRQQAKFDQASAKGGMSDADKAAHRDNTERIKQYTSKRRGDTTDLPGWAKDPKGKQPEANTRRAAPPPRRDPPRGQSSGGYGSRQQGWDDFRRQWGGENWGQDTGRGDRGRTPHGASSAGQKPPPRPGAGAPPPRPGAGAPRADDPFGGESVEDWIKNKRKEWAARDAARKERWAKQDAKWKAESADRWADFDKKWGTGSSYSSSPSPSARPTPSRAADAAGAAKRGGGLGRYAIPIGIGAAGLAGLGGYAYWKSRQPKPPPVAEARL
jgi:hypothetical protein